MKRVIYLDTETAALPKAPQYVDLRDLKAPANYKDPEAIANNIAQQKATRLAKAGLDFDLARIVVGGYLAEDPGYTPGPRVTVRRCPTPDAEYDLTRELLAICNDTPNIVLVGHNLLGFDLPLIDRRALDHGLPMSRRRRAPRYRGLDYGILDIQEVLSEGNKDRWRSLDWYCDRYVEGLNASLDDPLPGGGADVQAAIDEGRWDEVEGHLTADLHRLHILTERLNLLDLLDLA
jgi:hypothetical protein